MKAAAKEKRLPTKPAAILVTEHIAWHENGVLRQWRENEVVRNPQDIEKLLERGAQHEVIQ